MTRVRNSGVREKKKNLLFLSRRLIRKHKVFNVASRTGKRSGYEQEILILAPNRRKGFFVFLYLNFAFYHMSQDLDVVPAIAREKTREISHWEQNSVAFPCLQ